MVLVRLLDDNQNTVALEDVSSTITHLPDKVSSIEIGLSREYDDIPVGFTLTGFESLEYKDLTRILRCLVSSRKLRSISLYDHAVRDPDYVALLKYATQTTDKLVIEDDEYNEHFDSDVGFSSLMNGLLLKDGPKTLQLELTNEITAHQAQLFFQGVANSSCLERLQMWSLTFEDQEVATDAFVDALNQNQSLKALGLQCIDFGHFDEIFRAAVLNSKVESISMSNDNDFLGLGIALDVLSSQDCRLQTLEIGGLDMRVDDWDDNPTKINTSVNEVDLAGVKLDSSHLTAICTSFQSMTTLRLHTNSFQDLSPLDTLLIGDHDLKLQNLSLVYCKIDENCIIEFFHKLPQMKCIRRIELNGNPFLEESSNGWMDVLSNVIRRNTSLEWLYFGFHEVSSAERKGFYSRLEVALSVNRAWRRFMENDNTTAENRNTTKALPSSLWALVLERATKISYFACKDFDGPTLTSLKADVVYWLLRERMVAEVSFEP